MTKLYKGLAFFNVAIIEQLERAAAKIHHGNHFELAVSLDLNLSFHKYKIEAGENRFVLTNQFGIETLAGKKLESITINDKLIELLKSSPNKIFGIDFIKLDATPIHFSSEAGNVKLAYTDDAPTMEIDGVKMHRSMGISPWEDSRCKVRDAVKRGMDVLDTCTGLGYTAIIAVKQGANSVQSFERNEAVLKTASFNPWSADFFTSEKIKSNFGNVYEEIKNFKDAQFDAIIHDPPRFSHAGELYSTEFYGETFRVLRHGGKMFHYIGDPDSSFGKKHYAGINQRLREAGFETVIFKRNYGILCHK